jgi:ribosomal protein S18 acetylase RimI-like enzyme
VEAFNVAVKKVRRDWFDSRFGDQYHYLISMAVHPDYQRRGIATAMVNLGLARANKQRIPVALIASPMGAKLYKSLGFVQVGTHYAQAENDNETMEIPGMLYHGP